ncbi:MAG: IS21 family transposase [Betaproteobacteria bacterium]|nr:IS21 family transposase [Betaproteobacteria bacterium]
MPAPRIAMRRIREVLRLKDECGLTYSQIARSLQISKGSVANYLRGAEAAGLTHHEAALLDDAALSARLVPRPPATTKFAAPDFALVHRELKRKGVTLTLLWEEYRGAAVGVPYSRSRFFERYQDFVGTLRRSMRQTHVAGEKLFVDYAGQTVPVIDAASGEERRAHVFVAVWGASNFTYAEATWTETKRDWIGAHVNALTYAAGAPALLVPDNPKALIAEANRYEPEPNRTYQALAEHYGCAVLPARPRKPRDKAKVEAGVQLVERWILARLRHRRFFSLAELNAAIGELLEDLNNRPFQKLEGSRRSWFELLERPLLRALPLTPFEYAEFKRAKVSRLDYHVEFDRHYYSVPHALVGQEVELRVTRGTIEVLYRHRRVASHARSSVRGGYTTVPEHMPAAHRAHQQWSPQRLIAWAGSIGAATKIVVAHILASKPHPEQGYRACLGMLALARKYSEARLEAACARAAHLGAKSRKSVASILASGLDRQPLQGSLLEHDTQLPAHDNVRGPQYFH